MKQEMLVTDRLELKTFEPGLGEHIYEAVMETYALLAPWNIWVWDDKDKLKPHHYEQFGLQKMRLMEEGRDAMFLLFEQKTQRLVGCAGLGNMSIEKSSGWLGFWLRKSAMHQGYAQEAARVVLDFAANTLGHSCTYATHEHGNVNSQKTLTNLGFERCAPPNDSVVEAHQATPSAEKWLYYAKHHLTVSQ